jgi:hypothetical protein
MLLMDGWIDTIGKWVVTRVSEDKLSYETVRSKSRIDLIKFYRSLLCSKC